MRVAMPHPRTTAAPDADLTGAARIRNAALDLFAERGVKDRKSVV